MPAKKRSQQSPKVVEKGTKDAPKKRTKSEQPRKMPAFESYTTFGRAGTVFKGDWLLLAEACGGVEALADRVGVHYTTLYRWAVQGGVVPTPARVVITGLAHACNLPAPPMRSK